MSLSVSSTSSSASIDASDISSASSTYSVPPSGVAGIDDKSAESSSSSEISPNSNLVISGIAGVVIVCINTNSDTSGAIDVDTKENSFSTSVFKSNLLAINSNVFLSLIVQACVNSKPFVPEALRM